MRQAVAALLMLTGSFFVLAAAVGVVRLPDLFLRASATSKATTLGASCILLAVAVDFNELGVISRALAAIFFLFLTAPVAAHVITRASYLIGVPLWEGTIADELQGRYDAATHALSSEPWAGEPDDETRR